ncbi:hypothetical protein PENTCL1PPCAC_10881, partial [Pristionchus entomophagus]
TLRSTLPGMSGNQPGDRRIRTNEGDTFIAASQRPDGTWRKARKVKDGYVPQEEQPKYQSRAMQQSSERVPVGVHPAKLATRPKPPITAINAPKAPITPQDHFMRKIGNVQKKLDDIKTLEEKRDRGEKLELNQLTKIEKKDDLQGEIDKLTAEMNAL